jgi:hypothetical protein
LVQNLCKTTYLKKKQPSRTVPVFSVLVQNINRVPGMLVQYKYRMHTRIVDIADNEVQNPVRQANKYSKIDECINHLYMIPMVEYVMKTRTNS